MSLSCSISFCFKQSGSQKALLGGSHLRAIFFQGGSADSIDPIRFMRQRCVVAD
jgi:hypothetical protein